MFAVIPIETIASRADASYKTSSLGDGAVPRLDPTGAAVENLAYLFKLVFDPHGPSMTEMSDLGSSLWSTFQRVQENMLRGGLSGRTVQGRRMRTREVSSLDRSVSLNWALDEMLKPMA